MRSTELAARLGPAPLFEPDRDAWTNVYQQHLDAARAVEVVEAQPAMNDRLVALWERARSQVVDGARNAELTVAAPTGTISFMMGADTTGIEPDLGLIKTKKLVGGGTMQIVNQTVPRALRRLGYDDEPDRRHRRAHRGGPHGDRCSAPRPGALLGLRVRHGRAGDRLPRSSVDDGGDPAVLLRCDVEDRQRARGHLGRRGRAAADGGVGAGHQVRGALPRQLQGRAAAVDRPRFRRERPADRSRWDPTLAQSRLPLSPPTWWPRPPARPANDCPGPARRVPSSSAWRTARGS